MCGGKSQGPAATRCPSAGCPRFRTRLLAVAWACCIEILHRIVPTHCTGFCTAFAELTVDLRVCQRSSSRLPTSDISADAAFCAGCHRLTCFVVSPGTNVTEADSIAVYSPPAFAVPSSVRYCTVTGLTLAALSETVKTRLLPSFAETSLTLALGPSSSKIVPSSLK